MSEFFEGLGIFVGVFLGVVGGTGVMLLTQWVNQKRSENQKLKNLKFEFDLNIKKIDGWLGEIVKYRNAANSDTLAEYAGYFDLSRAVFNTTASMFATGELYQHVDYDEIGKLQTIQSEFSVFWENHLNSQIARNKTNFNRGRVALEIDFWEQKFKEHKQTLQEILKKLA